MEDQKKERIVKLTGKPVSKEMEDILKRLEVGQDVPLEEINATPEIIEAEKHMKKGIFTIDIPGREDMRAEYVDKMLSYGSASYDEKGNLMKDNDDNTIYKDPVDKGRRLDIIIGLPASGKSSAILNTISHEFHSKLLDNDEAKKMIPEFDGGWGGDLVHKESQVISDEAFDETLQKGENIVLPKVGGDADKLLGRYVGTAKEYDYSVYVHFVHLDRRKALGRMLGRFIDEARYMRTNLIDQYDNDRDGNKIEKTYQIIKKSKQVDGYSKWDNDVKRGEKPILLEYSSSLVGRYISEARRPEEEVAYGEAISDRQRDNDNRRRLKDDDTRGYSRRGILTGAQSTEKIGYLKNVKERKDGNNSRSISEIHTRTGRSATESSVGKGTGERITFEVPEGLVSKPFQTKTGSEMIRITIPNIDSKANSLEDTFAVHPDEIKKTGKSYIVTLPSVGNRTLLSTTLNEKDQSEKRYTFHKNVISNKQLKERMDKALSLDRNEKNFATKQDKQERDFRFSDNHSKGFDKNEILSRIQRSSTLNNMHIDTRSKGNEGNNLQQ